MMTLWMILDTNKALWRGQVSSGKSTESVIVFGAVKCHGAVTVAVPKGCLGKSNGAEREIRTPVEISPPVFKTGAVGQT